jgi:hypothetical protein
MSRRPRKRWLLLGLAAGLCAYEYDALTDGEDGDTISATFRWVFRTDTPAGRWAWRIAFGLFVGWFGPHIDRYSTPRPRN